jgi:hypothetical protein
MTESTGIEKVIAVIEDMRETHIIRKWAIGGAFAATLLDEPISTVDLDIFFLFERQVDPNEVLTLSEIYEYARSNGFSFDHEFINLHGWLVQFVESTNNVLWSDAIDHAQPIKIGEFDVPVIGPYYLAAMWLLAGRQKDFQKIALFFDSGLLDKTKFENIVLKYDLDIKWKKEKFRFEE